ncbi:hypothetical protein BD410DRAFT_775316 [Rickenella mellea]|uniref:C2H2-type domain-containing protein n=1 Tax=Rickenella mellea TaxID=50990 RepID=A0A4Y7PU87_9AGAM|nr:hypothetical protein BD410DRAFT_775316 [Rickenella mellea]
MFGTAYLAASDFSSFSYPRILPPKLCVEPHQTAIEERYCNGHHAKSFSDGEWSLLMSQGAQVFVDAEENVQGPHSVVAPDSSRSTSDIAADRVIHYDEHGNLVCEDASNNKGHQPSNSTFPEPVQNALCERECDSEESLTDTETTVPSFRLQKATFGRQQPPGSECSLPPPKRLRRDSLGAYTSSTLATSSTFSTAASTPSSVASTSSSISSWKCPHCPWVQRTHRLPDFLRHQRSHFISQTDWPCPDKCGKSFARKDSLKRHLNNRSTGCKRPPGYSVC